MFHENLKVVLEIQFSSISSAEITLQVTHNDYAWAGGSAVESELSHEKKMYQVA